MLSKPPHIEPVQAPLNHHPENAGLSLRSALPLVGVTLIALGISAVPLVRSQGAAQRDQARIASLYRVQSAIEAYEIDHGRLPAHVVTTFGNGWETSDDGYFLDVLVSEGYLANRQLDPVNDAEHHFVYHRYAPGQHGSADEFFILALTALEDVSTEPKQAPVRAEDRDWAHEYPFVLGNP